MFALERIERGGHCHPVPPQPAPPGLSKCMELQNSRSDISGFFIQLKTIKQKNKTKQRCLHLVPVQRFPPTGCRLHHTPFYVIGVL